jgi:hypothetical protein
MFKVIGWRQGRFGLSLVVEGFDFYFNIEMTLESTHCHCPKVLRLLSWS